jgi:hypothetical protein
VRVLLNNISQEGLIPNPRAVAWMAEQPAEICNPGINVYR